MPGRLLLLEAGSRTYALDFAVAGEVLDPFAQVFTVPFTPAWLSGAISYKGSAVPVLDLAEYLGEQKRELSGYLVLEPPAANLALRVEGPIRVVSGGEPLEGEHSDLAEGLVAAGGASAELLVPERLLAALEEQLRRFSRA
ncbi:MAG TPA: chemotaxis protein CheW [Verrucomicrobiae bacterium]|nr:chemotaxis protein CheW [Verrucomicrobiae bacterium]